MCTTVVWIKNWPSKTWQEIWCPLSEQDDVLFNLFCTVDSYWAPWRIFKEPNRCDIIFILKDNILTSLNVGKEAAFSVIITPVQLHHFLSFLWSFSATSWCLLVSVDTSRLPKESPCHKYQLCYAHTELLQTFSVIQRCSVNYCASFFLFVFKNLSTLAVTMHVRYN